MNLKIDMKTPVQLMGNIYILKPIKSAQNHIQLLLQIICFIHLSNVTLLSLCKRNQNYNS